MEHSAAGNASRSAISSEELLLHAQWMQQLALTLVQSPDRADDVVQAALLNAMEHPPRQTGSIRGWLRRVVRHKAIDQA